MNHQLTNSNHDHLHTQFANSVIPTPLRFADQGAGTGRGITIAFLDSGFVRHPDLTFPVNRIVAYEDVTGENELLSDKVVPESWHWHGTMTSVVAAGNGFLSSGVYRGLAPESDLVLVKVSRGGRILESDIVRGIRWVTENRSRYRIRILNISLGSDIDESYRDSAIDQAAEDAVKAGIVVVVAAGNSGCSDANAIRPPGNSPSVLTVGGYDDSNSLDPERLGLYCSSYGATIDGFHKPEILAPAIWVAAPVLPGSENYLKAELLSELSSTPAYLLEQRLKEAASALQPPAEVLSGGAKAISAWVSQELDENKFVGTHYMHVDGTSFAAPITSSIIARMLEVNPSLDPATIKNLLVSNATPIPGAAASRQGFGVVSLNRAEEAAEREIHSHQQLGGTVILDRGIEIQFHDDQAECIECYSSLDNWLAPTPLVKGEDGIWRTHLDTKGANVLRYKFRIDRVRWISDPENPNREDDGFGGWNSILLL